MTLTPQNDAKPSHASRVRMEQQQQPLPAVPYQSTLQAMRSPLDFANIAREQARSQKGSSL